MEITHSIHAGSHFFLLWCYVVASCFCQEELACSDLTLKLELFLDGLATKLIQTQPNLFFFPHFPPNSRCCHWLFKTHPAVYEHFYFRAASIIHIFSPREIVVSQSPVVPPLACSRCAAAAAAAAISRLNFVAQICQPPLPSLWRLLGNNKSDFTTNVLRRYLV